MTVKQKYHYVYRIKNIISNKHYYGCRSTNTLPTNDLGIKYFSSSTDNEFISDQRANPRNYKYIVVRLFNTRVEAMSFETMLHNKFNVGRNPNFYNKVKQTSIGFDTSGITLITEEQRKIKSEKWKLDNPNNYRDSSGINNPMYGSYRTGSLNPFYHCTHSIEFREFISEHNRHKSIYKDNEGNIFSLYVFDPRVISGELLSINVGRKHRQSTCPHCNKTGAIGSMKRYHFENCKKYENHNL